MCESLTSPEITQKWTNTGPEMENEGGGRRPPPSFCIFAPFLFIFGSFQARSDFHTFSIFSCILVRANSDFPGSPVQGELGHHNSIVTSPHHISHHTSPREYVDAWFTTISPRVHQARLPQSFVAECAVRCDSRNSRY